MTSCSMFQKLPKFLKVAEKTASCPKVAEQLVDRATFNRGAFHSERTRFFSEQTDFYGFWMEFSCDKSPFANCVADFFGMKCLAY